MSQTATAPEAAKAKDIIDPWKQPFEYLRSKGWRFEGNPHQPNSRWFDPTKSAKDKYEKRDVEVMGIKVDPADPERKKVIPCVVKTIQQVFCTPAGMPMCREEAVQVQLERDFAKEEAAKK